LSEIISIIKKSEVSKFSLFYCLTMAIFSSLLAVLPPQFLGFIITTLSGGGDTVFIGSFMKNIAPSMFKTKYSLAIGGIVAFLIFSFLYSIFRNFFCYFATIVSEKIIISIRKKLFSKILKISFLQYLDKPKGQVIYTVMNDTQRLEYIFSNPFYTLFSDLFDLVWISIFLILIDPVIFGMLMITVPVLYIASIKTAKIQKKVVEKIQKIDADLTTKIEQTLSGYETIKAFNGEKYEETQFYNKANESFQYRKKGAKSLSLFFPVEGILRIIGVSIIILYAITKINYGIMQIGMIAVLVEYANKFYSPIKNITQYYQTIQAGIVSAKRINEFFNMQEEINTPIEMIDMKQQYPKNKMIFNNISLNINNQNIIDNFSFDCFQGDLILIKGNSGCGKTSLIRILMGFYPIEDKKIYINGRDINSFDKRTLREKISYASQHVFLQNDSILNNITYPQQQCCSKENEIVNLLNKLNLSYKDTNEITGEEGRNLSGGERGRIAFARALMKKADILFLDEITAALDTENEDLVIEILKQIKEEGRTIFFISHSNNEKLLKIADKIINFQDKFIECQREAT